MDEAGVEEVVVGVGVGEVITTQLLIQMRSSSKSKLSAAQDLFPINRECSCQI